MNYKLFLACYQQDQLNKVVPAFTAFDNSENKCPELREYHIFKRLIDEGHTKDLDAWGLFSPRWNEKLKYSSDEINSAIKSNPGNDVYIFNYARIVTAYHYNVWEQGEPHHKGIVPITSYVLKKLYNDDSAMNELMKHDTMCYCSYFVATKEFWNEYIQFLDDVKYELDNLPSDLKELYESSANYGRDLSLNLFPFIVERLFSTFLHMNKKWKVYSHPYDYSVYNLNEFGLLLSALMDLKTERTLKQWDIFRRYFFAKYPKFLNLD